jgi:preprotein translocase subunit YajC
MPADILVFVLLVLVAYFVLVALPRKRARVAQKEILDGLAVGQEVLTAGGLLGVIRELDGDIVHLELADGIVVRMDRRAVAGEVLPDDEAGGTG